MMRASTPQTVKEQNLNFLVKLIEEQGPLSQRELAELSQLSVVTVNKLLPDLVSVGRLVALPETVATGGRKALSYAFNPTYQLLLVVQLLEEEQQFYLKFYVCDLQGHVLQQERYLGNALSWVGIKDIIREWHSNYNNIAGIIFGIPGVEKDGVAKIVVYPQLLHVDLIREIRQDFDLPVLIENDINAAVFGRGQTRINPDETLVGLYYPKAFPPGAGVYLNGQTLKGKNSFVGEVSYLPLTAFQEWYQVPHTEINLKLNLLEVLQSFICLYDPHEIVLYTNNPRLTEKELMEVTADLSSLFPMVDLPKISISRNFTNDYLQGLIAQGLALIST